MGMFGDLWGVVTGRAKAVPADFAASFMAGISRSGRPPLRGTAELLAAYSALPRIRAVVDRITGSVASTPWKAHRVRRGARTQVLGLLRSNNSALRTKSLKALADEDELEPITGHPALEFLNKRNPMMSGSQIRQVMQIHLELVGETFMVLERSMRGWPAEMWPIPPHWAKRLPQPGQPTYEFRGSNWFPRPIPAEDVLWIRHPDPLNPYERGTGIGRTLANEIDADEYAAQTTSHRFFNQGTPDTIISLEGLNDDSTKAFKQKMQAEYRGFRKVATPYVTNAKLKVQQLSPDFVDLDLVSLRQFEAGVFRETFGIPPEILGALEHCHDEQTECLTRRGWLHHSELTSEDEVATWNPAAERLEYHRPREVSRFDHDGPMHYWANSRVDVAVTPGHKLWVKHPINGPWRQETSSEASERAVMHWQVTGRGYRGAEDSVFIPKVPYGATGSKGHEPEGDGYNIPANIFAPFLGWYIADGHRFSGQNGKSCAVCISQRTPTEAMDGHAAEIVDAVEALGMGEPRVYTKEVTSPTGEISYMRTISISNKSLAAWLDENTGRGSENLRVPRCVFEWPQEAQRKYLDAHMAGDGWVFNGQGTFGIASVSKDLIGDLQQLGVVLGYRTNVCLKNRKGTPVGVPEKKWLTAHDCWQITFSGQEIAYIRPEKHLRVENYRGTVWCVDVPNHLFFTRRNGKVALHGNSNRATITVAEKHFALYVLLPRLCLLEETINDLLVPMFGDEDVVLLYENPVPSDWDFELQAATAFSYAFSIDELRSFANKPPLANGAGELHPLPFSVSFGEIEETDMADDPAAEEPAADDEEEPDPEEDDTETDAEKAYVIKDTRISQVAEASDPDDLSDKAKRVWSAQVERWIDRESGRFAGIDREKLRKLAAKHIDEFGGDRIEQVNDSTKRRLRKQLARGVKAGETVEELSDRVRSVYKTASSSRALSIARTEVARSSNWATHEVHREGGVERREWVAQPGARDAHSALDGQQRDIDQPFRAPGGETAMYPGGFGVASLDCNCRCSIRPLKAKSLRRTTERIAEWKQYDKHARQWEKAAEKALRAGFKAQQVDVLAKLRHVMAQRALPTPEARPTNGVH